MMMTMMTMTAGQTVCKRALHLLSHCHLSFHRDCDVTNNCPNKLKSELKIISGLFAAATAEEIEDGGDVI